MTRPFSEAFDYRSDSVEEDVPLPDGRDRLPLAGQEGEIPRNDDNDPVPCEDRELLPEEEAVLADFVGHSRVIAEWCIRHPEIRFKARELHALIEADTPARRSNFFYKANHQMQHHRVLGPYWFWQGSSGAREYWLDSGWRHSDTPKGLRKEDVAANDTVGRTALAGVTRRGVQPDGPWHHRLAYPKHPKPRTFPSGMAGGPRNDSKRR